MGRFLIATIVLFAPPALHAQSAGAALGGVVTDQSGATLPGIVLIVSNRANGREHSITTGSRGEYRLVALTPANYRIAASVDGFAPFAEEVVLNVGDEATLDITLIVAGIAERVVVPRAVDVTQPGPASVVTDEQIQALPEIGRSFLVLAQLLPGSGPLNATFNRFATTRFGGAADQRSGVTTLVDGGDVDDAQWGTPTINVSQDSVQEFKVFRYQFDAQYGGALNAVVSVVTKGGGNRASGSAYYFGRDEALNARNAFARETPPFDERRLGALVGGPLARNRTHALGVYESDDLDTARLIASHPPTSRFVGENGVFPAESDDRMLSFKIDHQFSPANHAFVRYVYANQGVSRLQQFPTSDTSQVDTFSRAHSVVVEDNWARSSRVLNSLRVHWFSHTSGGSPHSVERTAAIARPSVNQGLVNGGEWLTFPRTEVAVADTVYVSTRSHNLKLGAEFTFGSNRLEGRFFEDGLFRFQTDVQFDRDVRATWPLSFVQQQPSVDTYRSHPFMLFVQDDWRADRRLRINVGLRYDLDPTLRLNDFYSRALDDPNLHGLDRFVSRDRGTDTNNLQPRLGATYDATGDGTVVVRGGFGIYVARNRPWFQVRAMNQLDGYAIRIEDSNQLRLFPDVAAVTAAGGPRELGTVIPDDFVQAYALNTTAGVAWQIGRATSFELDYVHSYGTHQYGTTDRNLPPTGPVSATNPRPVPQFGQVAMLENFTTSWYDALESQLRTRLGGRGWVQVSYTLSKTYLDGVDFFLTQRGTQRTPQELGYGPSDQRHNLTLAMALLLPAGFEASAIVKLISGSPMGVQAGSDLDGDRSTTGDRPQGLPITVGRGDTTGALDIINSFRAGLAVPLPPVAPELLTLDPFRTVDLRITKAFPAGGDRRIELLLEAFNLLNDVNYVPSTVNRNMNSAQFLTRTGARDARQVQWGARFRF